jgi:hypothetical protein
LLTSAQATGAPDVLAAAAEWAASLPDPKTWDVPTIGLVGEYAMLGQDQCAFAAAAGMRILHFDREPIQDPWGNAQDLIADAAVRLLRACVERSFEPIAVGEMLTLALIDARPSHPLRIIGDLVRSIQPDGATLFALRGQLVDITTRWLADGEYSDKHWAVAAKAMKMERSRCTDDPIAHERC